MIGSTYQIRLVDREDAQKRCSTFWHRWDSQGRERVTLSLSFRSKDSDEAQDVEFWLDDQDAGKVLVELADALLDVAASLDAGARHGTYPSFPVTKRTPEDNRRTLADLKKV